MKALKHITTLATCPISGPQSEIGVINNAALVWENDKVIWIGKDKDFPKKYSSAEFINCENKLVTPGLIDCHTHLAFGGWRADEFSLRCQGKTYTEIAKAGGGIQSTVEQTRHINFDDLVDKCTQFIKNMMELGITTIEAKSGYGLNLKDEIKQLLVYQQLNQSLPIKIIPTCLGAHIVPLEYKKNRQGYIDFLKTKLIPAVSNKKLAQFFDIFIDETAFSIEEATDILTCAITNNLDIKIHADQLHADNGAALAAKFKAVSAEHLEYASDEGIKQMAKEDVVAVSLPLASLYLNEKFIDARKFIANGVKVAIATDFNPGSAPSYHLPFAMTLACIKQKMSPAEALKGVTIYAAKALKVDKTVGSLEIDKQADIAIFDVPDINHWLYHLQSNACNTTIKSGNIVYTK